MPHCLQCQREIARAIQASRSYYVLLENLEAAHIRLEMDLVLDLQARLSKALSAREGGALKILEHTSTNA